MTTPGLGPLAYQHVTDALSNRTAGLLTFLSQYVQLPSEAPKDGKAQVRECQQWLASQLRAWGWTPWVDVWEAEEGETNVAVRIPGRSAKPGLMFNGHSDVVPVSPEDIAKWRHPPYSGHVSEAQVWGRGTSDMKGGIAAFLWAAKAVVDLDVELEHDLVLTMNVGEESARPAIGISSVLDRGYTAPLVVVAEPSNLTIRRVAMGWLFFDVTVTGRSSHPATNYLSLQPSVAYDDKPGVDANEKMRHVMNAMADLGDSWATQQTHHLAPRYSTNLTLVHVHGGSRDASVPSYCRTTYAVVFGPGMTSSEVMQAVRERIDGVIARDPWLQSQPPMVRAPVIDPVFEPMETPADSQGVQDVADAVSAVLGRNPSIGCFPGPCDANFIAQTGVDTLIFGPGDLSFGCHGVDEHVPVEHVTKACQVYARLILSRCGR